MEIIGNTDRHHENWGVIHPKLVRKLRTGSEYMALFRSTMHLRLGRELEDERRAMLLAENRVGRYSERGRGGIFWSQADRRGPSPATLVVLATERYPELFRPTLAKLENLLDSSLREIVERIPENWMSPTAREFAVALIRYNLEKMRETL